MGYKIGAVSSRTGLSRSTLRLWEDEYGLLRPARSPRGTREYSRADIERVLYIRNLVRHEGLSLHGVAVRLDERQVASTNKPLTENGVSEIHTVLERITSAHDLADAGQNAVDGLRQLTGAHKTELRIFRRRQGIEGSGLFVSQAPCTGVSRALGCFLLVAGTQIIGSISVESDAGESESQSIQRLCQQVAILVGPTLAYFLLRDASLNLEL